MKNRADQLELRVNLHCQFLFLYNLSTCCWFEKLLFYDVKADEGTAADLSA